MKRILRGACMMALVALAFTSCKKEEKTLSFVATTEDIEIVNDDRVYINQQNKLVFEQGEQVVLYNIYQHGDETPNSYYGVYTARTTGPQVLFDYQSGPLIDHPERAENGAFFGVYPGQRVNNAFLAQGNYAIFNLPTVQYYREINGAGVLAERSYALAGMRTDMDNINQEFYFPMKNITGALVLWLKTNGGQKTVTSVVYEDKALNITGDVHVKVDQITEAELRWLYNNYGAADWAARFNDFKTRSGYFVDGQKGKKITLDCGDGVVINGTRKPFYIALRPLASIAGRTITVNFNDGTKVVIDDNIDRRIAPGQFRNKEENVDLYPVLPQE